MKNYCSIWSLILLIGTIILLPINCQKDDGNNSSQSDTIEDSNGNIYHTVTIGNQVWMVENLKVTKYNDGTTIPNVTGNTDWSTQSTGAYCNYSNSENVVGTYGRLYNWYAVSTRKLCPVGWHVPNNVEWNTLSDYLGGDNIAGGKLKSTGSAWESPNTGATNETGFTGLPGGDRSGNGGFASDGGHYEIGSYGLFWSSTAATSGGFQLGSYYVMLSYDDGQLDGGYSEYGFTNNWKFGKSVRCIKGDAGAKKDPVITWANPADITTETLLNETQLNAIADVSGTFVYTPALGVKLNAGTNLDLKVDFTPFDAYNYNSATKTVKINVTQFTDEGGLSSSIFNPNLIYGTMTDQTGNTYKTITIGTQTWMAENLHTIKYRNGDVIPKVIDIYAWGALTTGAYCNYANTTEKDIIATYGRLYNWYAVSDSRNIAPTGWHVPSADEWEILITYLGGESVAGAKLKEIGTTHWLSPNPGSTNESGFTAMPNGAIFMVNNEVQFYGQSAYCRLWSSTISTYSDGTGRIYASSCGTNWMDAKFFINEELKYVGFGVRLVKD